jgi:DNA-binding Xre family transcriptional regulator
MPLRMKSNLKEILAERDMSIRQLVALSNEQLKFESVRKMHNNETKQFHRETVGYVCETLDIELHELLTLEYYEKPQEADK